MTAIAGRYAIPARRASTAPRLGTEVFVYTTRGCFRNPARDRGRVIGLGQVSEDAKRLEEPVEFRGRTFSVGFGLRVERLVPYGAGVELSQLLGRLDLLPDNPTWSVRLRRAVVPLTAHDASMLKKLLRPVLEPIDSVVGAYLEACRVDPGRWTRLGSGPSTCTKLP